MCIVRKTVLVLAAMACGVAGAQVRQEAGDFVAAAERGDAATVAAMLAAGTNPDVDASGRTAIVAAAMNGHLEVVRRLLAAKADTESGATTATGNRTALYWALQNHHTDVARALVEGGARLRVADDNGRSALAEAARGRDDDSLFIVRAMLAAHAEVNGRCSPSPLPVVVRGASPPLDCDDVPIVAAISSGSVDILRALLAAGARTDIVLNEGATLLMWAISTHRPDVTEVVGVLLAAHPYLDARRGDGSTALIVAVKDPRTSSLLHVPVNLPPRPLPGFAGEIVRMLLAAGADARLRDNDGNTAAMLAARANAPELAELLQRAEGGAAPR